MDNQIDDLKSELERKLIHRLSTNLVWIVVEDNDVMYFHQEEEAEAEAREYAELVGGVLATAIIESRIIEIDHIEDDLRRSK